VKIKLACASAGSRRLSPPQPETNAPLRALVAFGRMLASGGIRTTPERIARFARALTLLDVMHRDEVFWAGFTTLCSRREDLPVYRRGFDAFWSALAGAPDRSGRRNELRLFIEEPPIVPYGAAERRDAGGNEVRWARFSAVEIEREKDFGAYTAAEFANFLAAVRSVRLNAPLRRERRTEPAKRGRFDPGRTLRRAIQTGGEPIRRFTRSRRRRPIPVVALCDVSGSMEPYTRALLAFVHAGVASGLPFEAFSLGTRAVRLTRAFATREPARALIGAARLAGDWAGGTRLGETLKAFLDGWGQRGTARGAIVVIVSDGWDRGDLALLGEQMQRLARLARRIVWVNPRKAAAGYEPLAGGMATALPFVDTFLSGHSLAALDELAGAIFADESARVRRKSLGSGLHERRA
jgi:uncharacterized protein with von Willebrand factor type A (vWA) domain